MLLFEGAKERRPIGVVELYLTPEEAERLIRELRGLLDNLDRGNAHFMDYARMNELNIVIPVETNVKTFDAALVSVLRKEKMVSGPQ